MKITRLVITTLCLFVVRPAFAQQVGTAQMQVPPGNPMISLSVSEYVPGLPDIASVGVAVQSLGQTAAASLADNAARMDNVIKVLLNRKIPRKEIQTTGISLNLEYDYSVQGKPPRFNGYRVSNSIRLVTRDIAKLGDMIDAMVKAGGSNIDGPSFFIENPEPLLIIARDRAMMTADAQAAAYAKRAGFARARLITVTENYAQGSPIFFQARGEAIVTTAASASTPVAPGQIQTGVTLTVQYVLER
jgi:uncharacterized protein